MGSFFFCWLNIYAMNFYSLFIIFILLSFLQ